MARLLKALSTNGGGGVTTLLLLLVYATVFICLWLSDSVPAIPQDTQGFDLEAAYRNLHQIAARPHPFNSHANDLVRSYILDELRKIAHGLPYIEIADDQLSNATWVRSHGISFEGSNILVKVQGTDPQYHDSKGVLFSAHFDSVSTAPGVTDDGIGVATLIQFVRYLTIHRTKRTAIFNINNGEEDGVNGAHAFLDHPWSTIPNTFLNLEGAAAGGRPLLFRASSTSPVRFFTDSQTVPHPHGNVLSADAFSRGVINSGTDYAVYSYSMEGLDLAFYQGRSKYHTKHDSIPGANGAKESLWAMIEATRGVGMGLLNNEMDDENPEHGVYFDFLGRFFFVFTQRTLLIADVLLLAGGPALLLFLKSRALVAESHGRSDADASSYKIYFRNAVKFWSMLLAGGIFQAVLVWSILWFNPFIIYSHSATVLLSTLSLAYLNTILIFRSFPGSNSHVLDNPAGEQHALLQQLFVFTWILLLFGTLALSKVRLGGTYFITILYTFVLLGLISEALNSALDQRKSGTVRYGPLASPGENSQLSTETTPLLVHSSSVDVVDENAPVQRPSFGCTLLQALLVIPIPIIILSQILQLFVAALSQTLSDGNTPVIVYAGVAALSTFIMLPLAPFTASIQFGNRSIFTDVVHFIILLVFVSSTAYNLFAFPFTQEIPLKVFFQQRIQVDISNWENRVIDSQTMLIGATKYMNDRVIPSIPSSWSKFGNGSQTCQTRPSTNGRLSTCTWDTPLEMIPHPGGVEDGGESERPRWFLADVALENTTAASIYIDARNTRSCKVFFDSRKINAFQVQEVDGTPGKVNLQDGFGMPEDGVDSVWVWRRERNVPFVLKVSWDSSSLTPSTTATLSGRVACEWAEYQSAVIGSGSPTAGESEVTASLLRERVGRASIPAFEEVLAFLPSWSVASKVGDGLVEVWGEFEI